MLSRILLLYILFTTLGHSVLHEPLLLSLISSRSTLVAKFFIFNFNWLGTHSAELQVQFMNLLCLRTKYLSGPRFLSSICHLRILLTDNLRLGKPSGCCMWGSVQLFVLKHQTMIFSHYFDRELHSFPSWNEKSSWRAVWSSQNMTCLMGTICQEVRSPWKSHLTVFQKVANMKTVLIFFLNSILL